MSAKNINLCLRESGEKDSEIEEMKPEDFGYVQSNNICLFSRGPLSNWWGAYRGQNSSFSSNEHMFNCVEQWMMHQKAVLFGDMDTAYDILQEKNPKIQKELGRAVKNYDDGIWAARRYKTVKFGINLKFEQNKELKDFLLNFHPQTLFCEASHFDRIYGNGLKIDDPAALDISKWKGQNLLGRMISDIRWGYFLDSQ